MKSIDIDHFANFAFLNHLKVSNGKKAAFLIKKANLSENSYESDLYLWRDGQTIRMTDTGKVSDFYWVGEELYFPAVRKKADQEYTKKGLPLTVFYRLPLTGGEAVEAFRVKEKIKSVKFISPEEFYFVADYDPKAEWALETAGGKADEAERLLKEESDYIVFDQLPFWSNGVGVTNGHRDRLYYYKNGEVTAVTDRYTNIKDWQVLDGGNRVLFISNRFEQKKETPTQLKLYEKSTGSITDVSMENPFSHSRITLLGDDEVLLLGSDQKLYGLNQDPNFYRYNFKTGERRVLDESHMHATGCSVGSDVKMGNISSPWHYDGKNTVYFTETVDDSCQLASIDLEKGEIRHITQKKGMVVEFAPYEQGFLTLSIRGNDGIELFYTEMSGKETQLTHFNTHLTEEYTISTPEELTFQNEVGDEIKGWIIKPVGFDDSKKYPVILDIHGGPKTAYGPNFFHEMQYWANLGYGVIFCNPTGSDGRGTKFSDIRGKYGTIDYNDIMTFVDVCLQKSPWMDGERMGVTGGSYGGFMTNWIIGHTDRFRCAASQRSISNWISKSNTTDIGYYFNKDQIGTDAWTDHDKIWWHSPLKYADRCKTPTLFIHSDEDYRCWLAEGLQMYYALKYFGVEARMCVFKGENHELSRSGKPLHRIRRLKEITQWFQQHLKD